MIEKISQMLGGKARAEKLTPERRAEIAKKAAAARWAKKPEQPDPEAPAKTVTNVTLPEPAPTRAPEPAVNPYDFLRPTERPGSVYWEDGDSEPSDRYVRHAQKQKRKSWWSCAPY